ncbi:hypothetical protein K438DRAFT_711640 [Mycena galopus ATCC 62051]|nr:hypothetical protein K438DRAFT_711640 [Mycena galopus ATCC 62051]
MVRDLGGHSVLCHSNESDERSRAEDAEYTQSYCTGYTGAWHFRVVGEGRQSEALNSIMFEALTLLTEKERQDIRDDGKYEKLLQEAINKLVEAEKQGKAKKIKTCKQRVDAIKASRNYEVDIPRLRGKQRGSWDFRASLD